MVDWVRRQRSGIAILTFLGRALLPVLVVLGLGVSVTEAKPRFSAVAIDARSGKVLFSRDPDGLTHPASLTKVMTLYLLFGEIKAGRMKLDTQLKVSRAAAAKAPSKLGLRPGTAISVDDAIRAIVTLSANDVAAVIAENLSSSEAEFAKRMTRTARDLGMAHTVYYNASGLPDPRQFTTARDMATLSLRVQRDFPEYYPYFRILSFTYGGRLIRTHNRLLGRYAGADGIKTGYVAASGFNLMSSAKRGDKRVVGVVMGARSAGSRNTYMMAMLDNAFPKCMGGSTIATAVEGTQPKSTKPPAAPVAKPNVKLAKSAQTVKDTIAAAKNTPEPVAADVARLDEEAAEASGDEDAAGAQPNVTIATVKPPDADSGLSAMDPSAETVLSKTTPDGTPLPFAVKAPSEDQGGVIVTPVSDPSWHIQIGAYPSRKDAQAILHRVKSLDLDLLNDKQPLTVTIQKGNDTLYRARFSGFTETAARAACKRLSRQGFGCVPMQPQS